MARAGAIPALKIRWQFAGARYVSCGWCPIGARRT